MDKILEYVLQYVVPALFMAIPGAIAAVYAYRSVRDQNALLAKKLPAEVNFLDKDAASKIGLNYDNLTESQREFIDALVAQVKVDKERIDELERQVRRLSNQVYLLGGVPDLNGLVTIPEKGGKT
jgi:hypothetical protein